MIVEMYTKNDARVAELAGRRSGVILRSEVLALGMSDDMVKTRLRAGVWRVIKPGAYLLAGFAVDGRSLLAAATAALAAVASHESAAELHDLPFVPRGPTVVTVPARATHFFDEVVVHQSTDLTEGYVVDVAGIPTTSVVRTVMDLATVIGFGRLRRLIEHCVISDRFTWDELESLFGQLARRGKPGVTRMRQVMEEIGPGIASSESQLEALAARILDDAGFLAPVAQLSLPWRDVREGRVDLAYPTHRLIIEVDGRRWHTQRDAFATDRKRDNLAQLAGWTVLRFTWRDLHDHPGDFLTQVRQALGRSTDMAV